MGPYSCSFASDMRKNTVEARHYRKLVDSRAVISRAACRARQRLVEIRKGDDRVAARLQVENNSSYLHGRTGSLVVGFLGGKYEPPR